ncbi:MAG TPA: NAD-dependent epimerase/dehydratase family protein [Natronosporangium sp.]|nr:NAD-dependent epimerase/dehydratase family protein [Natronosporangium sp.]
MRYVIVDCGSVGLELARQWIQQGHQVTGTTPDPELVGRIEAVGADAVLLDHGDGDGVREVVRDADGAVLATRPPPQFTRPVREQVVTYRKTMIGAVRAAASVQRRLVLFSSIAVYGDGGPGDGPVTEETPVTTALDPAAQSFAAVERMVRQSREATVLRLPELVTGHPDEPDPATLLRRLRDEVGEELPFDDSALVHTIDYRDAAAAVAFVWEQGLAGVYNAVPDHVPPPTVAAFLGKLAADAGLPPFSFAGGHPTLRRPVSSARLRGAGFRFRFSEGAEPGS